MDAEQLRRAEEDALTIDSIALDALGSEAIPEQILAGLSSPELQLLRQG